MTSPRNQTRRGKKAGKVRTDDNQERILNLAVYPALHRIAESLPARANPAETRGRPASQPMWVPLWMHGAARVFGKDGRNELIRWLRANPRDGFPNWRLLHDTVTAAGLTPPGPIPPSREYLRAFRTRFADPDQLLLLRAAFRREAIADAQTLGNLRPGGDRDLTRIDLRHTIGGDGTFINRFTDTEIHTDPETGEVFVVGGVTDDPTACRVQRRLTNACADGKTAKGVNHVSIQTLTEYGLLVLDAALAFGAEVLAAFPMIEDICRQAGGGVHAAVWDRAVNGYYQHKLALHHGVWIISPRSAAVAIAPQIEAAERDARDGLQRLQRQRDALSGTDRAPRIDRAVVARRAQQTLADLQGQPQTLGTSVYPTHRGTQVVTSQQHMLETVTHDTALGACQHDLWVDDGALVDVDPATRVKRSVCLPTRAELVPFRAGSGAPYRMTSSWLIPCPHGEFTVNIDYDLDPRPSATRPRRDERARALIQLQPVHRSHPIWGVYPYGRNNSEGIHQWVKKQLAMGKKASKHDNGDSHRAVSLLPEHQLLDFLGLALLRNSLTWQAYSYAAESRGEGHAA